MTADLRQKIQWLLAAAIVLASARTAWIFYQRHQEAVQPVKQPAPLNPDYYVTPKKLYPYDLKSAQELSRQPVWVQVGYAIDYVPYSAATHTADFSHPAGTFLPLEKLQIEEVAIDSGQLIAVFTKDGKPYAFSIGFLREGQYQFRVNDLLFFQDPAPALLALAAPDLAGHRSASGQTRNEPTAGRDVGWLRSTAGRRRFFRQWHADV